MPNKILFSRATKYLSWSLPLLFLGPIVIYNAFCNTQNIWHYLVLIIGIIISIFAVFLMIKGIKTIVNSLN